MGGRANEGAAEAVLAIPKCRENSRSINDAIDRRTEVMFKEAQLSKRWMASFLRMPENSITHAEFEEFKIFFQLALQQLIIAAVQRYKKGNFFFDKTVIAAIDAGELAIFKGIEVYHDVMHVVMARLLSDGGRNVTTLRPHYLVTPGKVHRTEGRAGARELDVIEERITDFFYDAGGSVGLVFREIKAEFKEENAQVDELIRRIFRTSGEMGRVNKMSRVTNFLRRMLREWETNPRVFYDAFKELMKGLL